MITVDEPIEAGAGGDGHTVHYDARIIDSTHFELRSERQGGKDGRVYTVYYVDANNQSGSCQFLVPHSKSPHQGAVDVRSSRSSVARSTSRRSCRRSPKATRSR
jgi:hypothetical protein